MSTGDVTDLRERIAARDQEEAARQSALWLRREPPTLEVLPDGRTVLVIESIEQLMGLGVMVRAAG